MIEDAGHDLKLFVPCPACGKSVFRFASGQLIEHTVPDGTRLCPRIRMPSWTLAEGLEYVRIRQPAAREYLYTLSLESLEDDEVLRIVAIPVRLAGTRDNFLDFTLWLDTANTRKLSEGPWNRFTRKREYVDALGRRVDYFVTYNPIL